MKKFACLLVALVAISSAKADEVAKAGMRADSDIIITAERSGFCHYCRVARMVATSNIRRR